MDWLTAMLWVLSPADGAHVLCDSHASERNCRGTLGGVCFVTGEGAAPTGPHLGYRGLGWEPSAGRTLVHAPEASTPQQRPHLHLCPARTEISKLRYLLQGPVCKCTAWRRLLYGCPSTPRCSVWEIGPKEGRGRPRRYTADSWLISTRPNCRMNILHSSHTVVHRALPHINL